MAVCTNVICRVLQRVGRQLEKRTAAAYHYITWTTDLQAQVNELFRWKMCKRGYIWLVVKSLSNRPPVMPMGGVKNMFRIWKLLGPLRQPARNLRGARQAPRARNPLSKRAHHAEIADFARVHVTLTSRPTCILAYIYGPWRAPSRSRGRSYRRRPSQTVLEESVASAAHDRGPQRQSRAAQVISTASLIDSRKQMPANPPACAYLAAPLPGPIQTAFCFTRQSPNRQSCPN